MGVPYINNINDVYPIGTLCDVAVEDMIEQNGKFYVMTLTPKNKVIVNVDQNIETKPFVVNGINHYESFASDLL